MILFHCNLDIRYLQNRAMPFVHLEILFEIIDNYDNLWLFSLNKSHTKNDVEFEKKILITLWIFIIYRFMLTFITKRTTAAWNHNSVCE